MKLFKSIGQSTQCQNYALMLILSLLLIETGLLFANINTISLSTSLSEVYRNPSIVFHLRLITALVVFAVAIPSTIKSRLIRSIPQVFEFNYSILERSNGVCAWLSGTWRIHILLLPLIVFNVVGLFVLIEQSPWLTPDSIEFLNFAPWRTAAYPIFFRSLGIWLSDPRWIVIFQFVATLAVIVVFGESVNRLFVNPLIGFLTGFTLLTSWPFLYNSFALLADQLFFICLTAHLASISFAAKSKSRTSFFCAGIFAGLAIALKPAGIFLIFAVPFLLVTFRRQLKSVMALTIFPFLTILAGSVFLNYWLFSSVSLSNIGGATTSVNSFFLLQKDTSVRPQKLARSIAASGEIHQLAMEKFQFARDRSDYFRDHVTNLNTEAVTLAAHYFKDQKNIERSGKSQVEYLSELFGKMSTLNLQYNIFANSEFMNVPWHKGLDHWFEINRSLTEIALRAILDNKIQWLKLTLNKLYAGWTEVIPFFSMKRNLGPNVYLKNSVSNKLLKSQQTDDWWAKGFTRYWVIFFDLIASVTFAVSILFPLPILIFGIILLIVIKFAVAVINRQHIDPVVAVLAYSAICLLLYHLEMSVVQVHFPRLLTAGMPPAVLLASSVLGLRQLIGNSNNDLSAVR